MNRRNSFKHRTTAQYDNIALEFDYEGSFRNSVNLFDAGGNKIGHYHADLWGEAGVFHDVVDGEDYHFVRYGKFYEYKFKLQLGGRDLVLYEIIKSEDKTIGRHHSRNEVRPKSSANPDKAVPGGI
jgi:hypothetical protein